MAHVFDTYTGTGWRRLIGCLKLQVTFRKRASNYRALLRKMTCEDKASYYSTPRCTARSQGDATRNGYGNGNRNLNSSRFLFIRNEKRPGTIIQDLVFHFDNHFESHLLGTGCIAELHTSTVSEQVYCILCTDIEDLHSIMHTDTQIQGRTRVRKGFFSS